MYLSKFTDYSFRILIYLGNHPNEIFTVDELSSILGLSTNHKKKIIYKLAKNNYIYSSKGRNGGAKLIMNPKDINLEALLEIAKDNLNIVEYFSSDSISCNLNGKCKLKQVLNDSFNSFKLSEYTLDYVI